MKNRRPEAQPVGVDGEPAAALAALASLLILILFSACSRHQAPRTGTSSSTGTGAEAQIDTANRTATPPGAAGAAPVAVQTQFRNVDFHIDSGVVLHIRRLRGELARTHADVPPTFDDKNSFLFKMTSGLVALAPGDLARLMNKFVFNYPDAPLHDLNITIAGERMKQQGTLRKGGVGIPFQIEGTISATPEGLVRLHSTGIKSAHLPVKGLM